MIELLTEETELTAAEAEEVVSNWERELRSGSERLEQPQAELTAAAEQAQAALTSAMLWGAVALIVLGAVAGWAGNMGANARRTSAAATGRY